MNDLMDVTRVPEPCELRETQASREWIIPSSLTRIQPLVSEALAEMAWVDFVYDRGTEVRLWLTPPDGATNTNAFSHLTGG